MLGISQWVWWLRAELEAAKAEKAQRAKAEVMIREATETAYQRLNFGKLD